MYVRLIFRKKLNRFFFVLLIYKMASNENLSWLNYIQILFSGNLEDIYQS